jgi:hypothetical protein
VRGKVLLASLEASELVRARVDAAIEAFLHPLTGRDGQGWEFGRQPHASDFYRLLTEIEGVHHVAALTVDCDPPLEQGAPAGGAGGGRPSRVPGLRASGTYLIYSSGAHALEYDLAADLGAP